MKMDKKRKHDLVRFGSYIIGLLLFWAPFYGFSYLFFGAQGTPNATANACSTLSLRMFLPKLATLEGWQQMIHLAPGALGVMAVLIVAFLFGPLWCGKLCAAGAFPEYLSRFVPDRFKVDIEGKVNAAAIRYGFLAGFLITPLVSTGVACALCNWKIFDFMILGLPAGFFTSMSSTYVLVTALWIFVGGIFMKGGRGWCNFLCPVGAVQNLIYSAGSRLGFTYKLKYASEKCKTCLSCVKVCPMRTVSQAQEGRWEDTEQGTGVLINRHTCITCNDCVASCPHGALTYGSGKLKFPSPAPLQPAGTVLTATPERG